MLQEIIIIGAGIKNARKIKNQYQMFLEIDGRTSFQIILDEVAKLDGDSPVYLWGSEPDLREFLSPIMEREKNRREIVLVPEKGSPVESLIFTYLEYLRSHDEEFRKVSSGWDSFGDIDWELLSGHSDNGAFSQMIFYLPCDIPLVAEEEIEFLIKNHKRDYDLHMGWSLKDGFEEVLRSLRRSGVHFDYTKSKMSFSRFRALNQPVETRFNNFFCGKPLRIDPNLYAFIQTLYESRNLIKKKSKSGGVQKSINPLRFLMVFKAFVKYLQSRRKRIGNRVLSCGNSILNTYFHSLGLEGRNFPLMKELVCLLGFVEGKPSGDYLDLRLIERNVERLTGNKIGMYLSNVVGPLFDIDTEYEYEFVRFNYGRLRNQIARYYAEHGLSTGI